MDKRVIFAVAGSGKTTYIIDNLSGDKRSLIVTYTNGNYDTLREKITKKFDGQWPENITLMTYFSFLYNFCYKPFLADRLRAKGIIFESNFNLRIPQNDLRYFISSGRYLYSNRLSFMLGKYNVIDDIKARIKKYFDEFVIDEVQDIAGRDFTFLESLMETEINMLFVGDFYQHTFDTSRDGNTNSTLFDDKDEYEARFTRKGLSIDNNALIRSWRCSRSVCDFIRDNLDIVITSNRPETDDTTIEYVTDAALAEQILDSGAVIKLHYRNGAKAGASHKNWGETKGEDHHQDVCVLLNKTTASKRKAGKLSELAPMTKNKLYVAITRAKGNVYFIDE